jgi:DNA-binding response OmpR family regulator
MDRLQQPLEPICGGAGIVLMAEAHRPTSELYQRALGVRFGVLTATDADSIISLLHTRPIAALILEPMIFDGDGWETLRRISAVCAEQHVPLVVCSTLDERRKAKALGVTAYLIKPTLPSTLLNTIGQLIENGRH